MKRLIPCLMALALISSMAGCCCYPGGYAGYNSCGGPGYYGSPCGGPGYCGNSCGDPCGGQGYCGGSPCGGTPYQHGCCIFQPVYWAVHGVECVFCWVFDPWCHHGCGYGYGCGYGAGCGNACGSYGYCDPCCTTSCDPCCTTTCCDPCWDVCGTTPLCCGPSMCGAPMDCCPSGGCNSGCDWQSPPIMNSPAPAPAPAPSNPAPAPGAEGAEHTSRPTTYHHYRQALIPAGNHQFTPARY